MATHSSTLAWKVPWMEEPGGLQSMGSRRVRHDWSDLAAAAVAYHLWYFELLSRIDAFELWCWRRLLSPLDCKEIQPVHPKGDQSWVFISRTDVEAETAILWPPDVKRWLIGKDLDAGKDWGQEEKGTTEDEMVGWHHRLDGHEFGWTPGVGDGQGGLACCGSWGRKGLDTTERLNW